MAVVPVGGRGSLPFALLQGESLVAVASWAVGEAGATPADFDTPWATVVDTGLPLLVHDPLCPAAPVGFLADALEEAVASGEVVVAVLPVTDTVKEMSGGTDGSDALGGPGPPAGVVGRTVDRSALLAVASPVVLPAEVVAALGGWPDLDDLADWVERLRARFPVRYVDAPAEARRVGDASDLTLLEATRPAD